MLCRIRRSGLNVFYLSGDPNGGDLRFGVEKRLSDSYIVERLCNVAIILLGYANVNDEDFCRDSVSSEFNKTADSSACRVGIVGGGVAGSTAALRLAELGVEVVLFEQGPSLVNGPPMCHLHAGGNFYREISDQQCLTLLHQSIDTLRLYPYAANIRPTVFCVPVKDPGCPRDLLPRLEKLKSAYAEIIREDPANEVLGPASDYFKVYQRADLERLAQQPLPTDPQTLDDWLVPVAKHVDLDQFKLPVIVVQEYGLSAFRIGATASLTLEQSKNCTVLTNTRVKRVEKQQQGEGWDICYETSEKHSHTLSVDYLVNACGYRTGTLDDMAGFKRQRMVEFKAAYLAKWPDCKGVWPEVVFYGERGTPGGMAQLTPYPEGYFIIHGMTEDITLFKGGLAASCERSAQPQLPTELEAKITSRWDKVALADRTRRSIEHVAQFIPQFHSAEVGGSALYGAQQIPGRDPSLRASDVSFTGTRYARSEIVKSSSALSVANQIADKLRDEQLLKSSINDVTASTERLDRKQVLELAEQLAVARDYPKALA